MESFTSIDTGRIDELTDKIIELTNEYDNEITKMFKRLSEVPYESKEWIGKQSEKYARLVLMDKQDFIDFGSQLKSYAKKVSSDSKKIDDAIKKSTFYEGGIL